MKNKKTMFVDPRKVGFQTWVRQHLEKPGDPLKLEGDKAFPLQAHQKVIARFYGGRLTGVSSFTTGSGRESRARR